MTLSRDIIIIINVNIIAFCRKISSSAYLSALTINNLLASKQFPGQKGEKYKVAHQGKTEQPRSNIQVRGRKSYSVKPQQ